jgi:hypothetical protein
MTYGRLHDPQEAGRQGQASEFLGSSLAETRFVGPGFVGSGMAGDGAAGRAPPRGKSTGGRLRSGAEDPSGALPLPRQRQPGEQRAPPRMGAAPASRGRLQALRRWQ